MVDVDHCKAHNDLLGHSSGDKCLRQVAEVLVSALSRESDTVFRYGGEEFLLVLPDTDVDGIRVLASRIHKLLEHEGIPTPGSSVAAHVTVSIGGAACRNLDAANWNALVSNADHAPLEAKREGRNRTVVFNGLLDDAAVEESATAPHARAGSAVGNTPVLAQDGDEV
jgi:diguanylate cyclase (GGDEF)-like protein